MNYQIASSTEIASFINECYKRKILEVGIILYNGDVIYGILRSQSTIYSNGEYENEDCLSKEGFIELYYPKPFREISVFVPCEHVAGMFVMEISQKKEFSSDTTKWAGNYYDDSIIESLFYKSLIDNAQKHNYPINRHLFCYQLIKIQEHFKWGNVEFNSFTPLYADWDYLNKTSPKINSFGFTIFSVGLSFGKEKDLMKVLYDKLTKDDKNNSTKRLLGYIHLNSFDEKNVVLMENSKWYPAFITDSSKWLKGRQKTDCFHLIYLNQEKMLFPLDQWDRITQKLSVFAECFPQEVNTQMGKVSCYYKARAIAYIE
jgi:hypothetical protein